MYGGGAGRVQTTRIEKDGDTRRPRPPLQAHWQRIYEASSVRVVVGKGAAAPLPPAPATVEEAGETVDLDELERIEREALAASEKR